MTFVFDHLARGLNEVAGQKGHLDSDRHTYKTTAVVFLYQEI